MALSLTFSLDRAKQLTRQGLLPCRAVSFRPLSHHSNAFTSGFRNLRPQFTPLFDSNPCYFLMASKLLASRDQSMGALTVVVKVSMRSSNTHGVGSGCCSRLMRLRLYVFFMCLDKRRRQVL